MAMQPKEQRLSLNHTIIRAYFQHCVRNSLQTLVRSIIVIILNIAFNYPLQLPVGKNDEIVGAFFAGGAEKTLCIDVHVEGIRHNTDIFEIIFVIWEPL